MVRCLLATALFWLGFAPVALPAWLAPADEVLPRIGLPGEEPRTARRLADADKLAAQQQWAEALDEYQRILTEAGDDLVPLDPRRSVQARYLCHLRLAALPPPGLQLYRARVDPQAKKWLDQGSAQRDSAVLRRLVAEAFCSRFTDQALDLLGDLAFERGDFEEAAHWWRLLTRPASELAGRVRPETPPEKLLYPDPKVDLARVRAKLILIRLFQGERGHLSEELQGFRDLHATAQGELAGRRGTYAETLAGLAGQKDILASPLADESWPTFAGAASRQRVLARAPGRLGQLRPLEAPDWCVRLETGTTLYGPETREVAPGAAAPTPGKPTPPLLEARTLSCYPVIAGNQVLVADARSVTAYKLSTGRPLLRHEIWTASRRRGPDPAAKAGTVLDVSYPLTVAEGHIFARLGGQALGPPSKREVNPDTVSQSVLVCLLLQPEADGFSERWNEHWLVRPQLENAAAAEFEGAPIVHRGRVYIAVSRFVGVQTQTALACYDAQTGALRWQRPLCMSQELREDERRTRHHLLTLAGPLLVYCSHAGAIVAVDAATGRPAWAVRYPSRENRMGDDAPSPRGLAPCLYADGRIFVAPADWDRLLCLDAATGQRLWESTPVEVVHLLGVASGRVIFTFTTTPAPGLPPRSGIRAIEATRGSDLMGWLQPSDGSDFPTFGRGFLAGNLVFWPTIRGLRVLYQNHGEAAMLLGDNEIRGNLAVANNCLVMAGVRHLWGYVAPASLLEHRRREAALPDAPALAHYQLALAEADAGLKTEALATLTRVERLASPEEVWQGRRLLELARHRRHELLCDFAGRAESWDEAAARLMQAAGAVRGWVKRHLHKPESCAVAEALPVDNAVPLTRTWSTSWSETTRSESKLLLVPEARRGHFIPSDCLAFAHGCQIVSREASTGKLRWERTCPTPPCWIGQHASAILVAEVHRIHSFRLTDGEILWERDLRPESLDPEPRTTSLEETALRAFQLVGSSLFFLQGQRLLFALDANSGRVFWNYSAPAAGLRPPAPGGRFWSRYQAGENALLVQTSGGRRWILDRRTGHKTHDAPTSTEPWPRTPRALDERRVCLVPDARQVMLLDLVTGEEIWTYALDPQRTPSLSGEAPQVLCDKNLLLVLVAFNYGYELESLDLRTGKPLWPSRPLVSRSFVDFEASALDETAVYFVSGGVLVARSLADGKLLWQLPLSASGGSWQTVRSRHYVVVFPRAPGETHAFPVLFCDPKDGQVIQRLNFPADGSQAAVQWFAQSMAVLVGNQAWGLTAMNGR